MSVGRVVKPGVALFQFEISRTLLGVALEPLVVWVIPEDNWTGDCDCKTLYRLDPSSYKEALEFYKAQGASGHYVCLHMGRFIE